MLNTQVAANSHPQAQKTGYGGVEIKYGSMMPEGFICPAELSQQIVKQQVSYGSGFQFEEIQFDAGESLSCIRLDQHWRPMTAQEIHRLLKLPPEPMVFSVLATFGGQICLAHFERKAKNVFGVSLQRLEDALGENCYFDCTTTIFFGSKRYQRGGH